MHELTVLQDLAVVMIVAGLVTLLFHRLKQPVVLGYILAGLIIGPHTPPFPLIQDPESIDTLAQLGIIFLMFSLGLEFNLRKLTQVGAPAFIAALLAILLMFWLGFEIGRMFGWGRMNCVFLGAMLSMSSTTVIVKVLGELDLARERFAQLIFGILILEDIMGIAMIALLSGIAKTGNLHVMDVGLTLGKLGAFLAMLLVVGLITVPRLIGYVARFKSNEMLIVAVVGLCFGVALLTLKLGYSVALGAFIIGAIIAEAREIHRVAILIEPVRDMFSAVFFVAIGMLIDPAIVAAYAWPIVVITVAVVVGQVVACTIGTFMAGVDGRTSLRVGMGLAQIGEFSFIIAALGQKLDVTSKFLYPIAVAVSAITTLLTPYLIKSADGIVDTFERVAPNSFVRTMGLYTRWVADLRRAAPRHPGLRIVRSVLVQIILNVALIAGVFIAAAFAVRTVGLIAPWLNHVPGGARTACWMAAVVVTLPIYVATVRKLQAAGMMLAEISISMDADKARAQMLRTVMANIIFAASLAGLGMLTLLLSSTILPPGSMLVALLPAITLAVYFFWTHFNRLYSRAKFALVETWSNPPPAPEPTRPLSVLLREAEMETLAVIPGPVAGKLIREIELRRRTGASIVAIERNGQTIMNPSPDEELQAGDKVLLLGNKQQLSAAKQLMNEKSPA